MLSRPRCVRAGVYCIVLVAVVAGLCMANWNTKDNDIETNGNLVYAVKPLQKMKPSDLVMNAETVKPALVMKSPWKYYGKILKLTGVVCVAQDYPPGSDLSKLLNAGKECGELVLLAEDFATIIDYLHMGDTGDLVIDDMVRVYGYAVGLAEVPNKLGGTTTQLAVVGKLWERVPQ